MKTIEIVEVGARDGLQNEKVHFSTEHKVNLINKAVDAGIRRLEVASFVHPKLVPQMADAEAVIADLPDNPDIEYIGLVLNKRGYLRALATREGNKRGVDEVGCVVTASDTFGQKNQGQNRAETIQEAGAIMKLAKNDGVGAQVTVSTAFGCPFEGKVQASTVLDMAKELAEFEPREIAIADTIGVGIPNQVEDILASIKDAVPHIPLRAHFHNTRNTGIANAWAAYKGGATVLDSSVAGLGGCPFAPRATGNIGTEDLLYLLSQSGVQTGIELDKVIELAKWIETILGRPAPSAVSQAGGFPVPQA
ncbi:hydroxymethylglutaryl-CoA lyase [Kordiimonas laminariae]|uniref:hydroxymethylglutaryl-CoA lyase n=1 Tax=Kordiimonas laminariae TaxID=2917717 RepID=UPI001FF1D5B9|nr:hydroxymethylglutaryl-CoA lyase [Kordiimonas laminariae]MCK0069704.1 hydroxymethylglutaryl-CoA lyase [Kordiimonas laminariae]